MRKSAPSQVRRLHDAEACNRVRHGQKQMGKIVYCQKLSVLLKNSTPNLYDDLFCIS